MSTSFPMGGTPKPPALIHPDHLLDRGRALSPDERQRLGAHLAVCRPCAWEQAATDDFAREQAAFQLNPAQLDRLVTGALARAGVAAGARPRSLRSRLPTAARLAAVAVIAAALGAAMTLTARSPRDGARVDPPLASTEANLDAGAVGASGGDS